MRCPSCQHENRPAARFCESCGNHLARACPACGTEVRPEARFCDHCGSRLDAAEPASQPRTEPEAARPERAERRQLTVLFCDLVGSTALSERLDAEDFRQVILNYQQVAEKVIRRYGGHVAQYLGDGLLVYFGYPQGLEDAPMAAVRVGLGILDAVAHANHLWTAAGQPAIAIRIGVHTGLVVVDEHLAMGETTNIAARLEGLAPENSLVISPQTLKLVRGWFETESLGAHTLKGISQPMEVFRVRRESGARSRLNLAGRTLSPLLGREQELRLLLDRWTQAKTGGGQAVLLTGEPGIGKSRLTEALKVQIAEEPDAWLTECLCSAYHENSAFYPIIDFLERTAVQFGPEESPQTKLEKLEGFLTQHGLPLDQAVPLFAELLSIPLEAAYAPAPLLPAARKKKTMEALLHILLGIARRQPVLLVVEDLHWADPSTLEWLSLFLEQAPAHAVFAVFTARPEFQSPWPPHAFFTRLTLPRLPAATAQTLSRHVCQGKSLPAEVLAQITSKTDGVPLFVEELTQMVLESGLLREGEDGYELSGPLLPLAIPTTLQDSLMARLDRLSGVKQVAQTGAVLGRAFSFELLQAVAGLPAEALERDLARLVSSALLFQRGRPPKATYQFKHALIQDTAYSSLLKSRRQELHQRVATVLESQFPQLVDSQPELLAHHLTEAGLAERAVPAWTTASRMAVNRYANAEALRYFDKALALLERMPQTPQCCDQQVNLLAQKLGPIINHLGYTHPQIEAISLKISQLGQSGGHSATAVRSWSTTILELSVAVGEETKFLLTMYWLGVHYTLRGEYDKALAILNDCLSVAQTKNKEAALLVCQVAIGEAQVMLGNYRSAIRYFEEALRYESLEIDADFLAQGNPIVSAMGYCATCLQHLGYSDQAFTMIERAREKAREKMHPVELYRVETWTCGQYVYRGEWQLMPQPAEQLFILVNQNDDAFWLSIGYYFKFLSQAMQGDETALSLLHDLIEQIRQAGVLSFYPVFCTDLAGACLVNGKVAEGLRALQRAQEVRETVNTLWRFSDALCIQGNLYLLENPVHPEAETCFLTALEVARRQDAKWYELLAAKSLARLWDRQGRRQEAYELLHGVYSWFTEGFELADMREAKTLLEEWRLVPRSSVS